MSEKRLIEIFSAGCAACDDVVELVNKIGCSSCEISILDMHDEQVAARASAMAIKSVPAVVINGKLADCCTGRGVNEDTLRKAGVGEVST